MYQVGQPDCHSLRPTFLDFVQATVTPVRHSPPYCGADRVPVLPVHKVDEPLLAVQKHGAVEVDNVFKGPPPEGHHLLRSRL